ncbi:glycerophosphodiester phosphodiesterase GDPD6-like [Bradysia coprophila]|uniref:glycerophosphodiester phosphodiesterase GDPD6-like n=1 Tax=Bradysia coprophila TaxID=38358 RepID=UPI00187D7978|nr:glycerophosphodiester phosphodiesterase GDPD6-like [Bradysia coprophila]
MEFFIKLFVLITWSTLATGQRWNTYDGLPSIFLAHQGEKVFMPPHTLPGYEIAAITGAEYVEPDLVMTRDNVLVCYHDVTLKRGTNIEEHPEFEHLRRNFSGIIGVVYENIVDDFFVEDLTLAELKTLKVKQNNEGVRLQYFNDHLQIPTFQEFIDVIHKMTVKLNRTIGIIPELKHPSFRNRNSSNPHFMEDVFLNSLTANGYALNATQSPQCRAIFDNVNATINCPPVIIQNFDKNALAYISTQTDLDLMMVVHPDLPWVTFQGMAEVSLFSRYYCVWKEYMYVGVEAELAYNNKTYDAELIESMGGFVPAKEFVTEAHRLGMKMALFTINDSREPSRRGCAITPGCDPDDKEEELFYFFEMGVDAIFIESLAESREIRMKFDFQIRTNQTKV